MIVSRNKFNTQQKIQNKKQNDTNFGKLKLPKIPAQIPIGKDGLALNTKSIAIFAGLIGLLSVLSIQALTGKKHHQELREDVAIATKTDSSDIFYKSSLTKEDSTDYLKQVVDSVYGGKSTPNKTFKTDSLVRREADLFKAQSDSIADNAINELRHADQLRNFAQEILKTK